MASVKSGDDDICGAGSGDRATVTSSGIGDSRGGDGLGGGSDGLSGRVGVGWPLLEDGLQPLSHLNDMRE